jgi:Laminin G domain
MRRKKTTTTLLLYAAACVAATLLATLLYRARGTRERAARWPPRRSRLRRGGPAAPSVVPGALHLDGRAYATLPSGVTIASGDRYTLECDISVKGRSHGLVLLMGSPTTTPTQYVSFWVGRDGGGYVYAVVKRRDGEMRLRSAMVVHDGKRRTVTLTRDRDAWTLYIDASVHGVRTEWPAEILPAASRIFVGGTDVVETSLRGVVSSISVNRQPITVWTVIGHHERVRRPPGRAPSSRPTQY